VTAGISSPLPQAIAHSRDARDHSEFRKFVRGFRLRPEQCEVRIPSGYGRLGEFARGPAPVARGVTGRARGTSRPRQRREQRIRIDLAAWATDIAAKLNAKYGSLVDLRVGAMTFPARQLWVQKGWYERWYQLRGVGSEPAGLDVEPLSPLSVRTGRSAREDVLVTNRAGHRQVLSTNGELHSAVTDSSGNFVGLDVGPSPLCHWCSFRSNLTTAALCLSGSGQPRWFPTWATQSRRDSGGWSSC